MSAYNSKTEKEGLYLYVTPVAGVYLGETTGGEYRIDKVTLFSPKRFLRTRRYTFVYNKWRQEAKKCAALNTSQAISRLSRSNLLQFSVL